VLKMSLIPFAVTASAIAPSAAHCRRRCALGCVRFEDVGRITIRNTISYGEASKALSSLARSCTRRIRSDPQDGQDPPTFPSSYVGVDVAASQCVISSPKDTRRPRFENPPAEIASRSCLRTCGPMCMVTVWSVYACLYQSRVKLRSALVSVYTDTTRGNRKVQILNWTCCG
jgi:hypothetical protein